MKDKVYVHVWGLLLSGDMTAVAVPRESFNLSPWRREVTWRHDRWEANTHVAVVLTAFPGSFVPGIHEGRW